MMTHSSGDGRENIGLSPRFVPFDTKAISGLTVWIIHDKLFCDFQIIRGKSKIMDMGIRWTVCDHYGNNIYLTQERWQHIVEPFNHPEMSGFERQLKETVQSGMRKQDSLNPQKYRYIKLFEDLPDGNTQL